MKYLFALILCLGLFGCATTPKEIVKQVPQEIEKQVSQGECAWSNDILICNEYEFEILSDPPGAKIEIEDEYRGETPLSMVMNGKYSERSYIVIHAYPTKSGQYRQDKLIRPRSNGFPKRIYFSMFSEDKNRWD